MGESGSSAKWIWSNPDDPHPDNRWTWFRKRFELSELPEHGMLFIAADSTARLLLNGTVLLRKVSRYHEHAITSNRVNALPSLKVGENELIVLHHNWGERVTFQRTANRHAGLYVDSSFVVSDESWQWTAATQFLAHTDQTRGVAGGVYRVRYPVFLTDTPVPPSSSDAWENVSIVSDGPWPEHPKPCETKRQREYPEYPIRILNSGTIDADKSGEPPSNAALSKRAHALSKWLRTLALTPVSELAHAASLLTRGRGGASDAPFILSCEPGHAYYVTVDFAKPVHGYPFVKARAKAPVTSATENDQSLSTQDRADPGALIDIGYGELPISLYSGARHVTETGWIDVEGVVGSGLADRIALSQSAEYVEIPEERTARWLILAIHTEQACTVEIERVGIVRSQYPLRHIGTFSCGDERIERFVRLALIHAEITMTDAYVDTPGREDGQWLEDLRPRALLTDRWFGDSSLRRFMLRTVAESQNEHGNFHPFPPSNYPFTNSPYDWSVQWVATLYDEYMWSGDTELVSEHFDTLEKYWSGLLSKVGDDDVLHTSHVFGDIRVTAGMNTYESSGIVTPWIIQRLEWSVELALAIGKTEHAVQWRSAADRLRKSFRTAHVCSPDEASERPPLVFDTILSGSPETADSTTGRGFSQAGHTVALEIGLFSPEESAKIADWVFPEPDGTPPPGFAPMNNPTYLYRTLKALSLHGRSERALRVLLERMAPYLPFDPRNPVDVALQGYYGGPLPEYLVRREDQGLTPVIDSDSADVVTRQQKKIPNSAETSVNTPQPEDDTGSHGWAAVPLLWLHEQLLGVQITAPGGRTIRVRPNAAGLPYVSGHTGTPRGSVWIDWQPLEWEIEISIPDNVTVELLVPHGYEHERWTTLLEPEGESGAQAISANRTGKSGDQGWTLSRTGTYRFGLR